MPVIWKLSLYCRHSNMQKLVWLPQSASRCVCLEFNLQFQFSFHSLFPLVDVNQCLQTTFPYQVDWHLFSVSGGSQDLKFCWKSSFEHTGLHDRTAFRMFVSVAVCSNSPDNMSGAVSQCRMFVQLKACDVWCCCKSVGFQNLVGSRYLYTNLQPSSLKAEQKKIPQTWKCFNVLFKYHF